jgi:hypothetical protein
MEPLDRRRPDKPCNEGYPRQVAGADVPALVEAHRSGRTEGAIVVKHIVLWTLRARAEGRSAAENAREMKARLEALNGLVPGLLSLQVGMDFGRSASSADVALYSEFTDRESLDAYQVHPEHMAVAGFTAGVCERRVVADYEVEIGA